MCISGTFLSIGDEESEQINWFWVTSERPETCRQCGQVFAIENVTDDSITK